MLNCYYNCLTCYSIAVRLGEQENKQKRPVPFFRLANIKKEYQCRHWLGNGPVTLGSDYSTILKSDPILLILKSELDVSILKIDKFAVTLLRFIGADFIARKMRQ